MDENSIFTIMVNYDKFSTKKKLVKLIGHHVIPQGNFIFYQSNNLFFLNLI